MDGAESLGKTGQTDKGTSDRYITLFLPLDAASLITVRYNVLYEI